jgi:hypothetical protein
MTLSRSRALGVEFIMEQARFALYNHADHELYWIYGLWSRSPTAYKHIVFFKSNDMMRKAHLGAKKMLSLDHFDSRVLLFWEINITSLGLILNK